MVDMRTSQSAYCGLGHEPFLSRAVALIKSVDDYMKDCHIWGLPTGSVRVVYMDWHGKCMCHLYLVSLVGCTLIRIL
jgi:hypothetical protein